MKTNKIQIFFSIISFCFLVTSCNNLLSELTQQKSYIQISTNLDNSNQRTVLPNFSVVLGQGYTWELYRDNSVLQTWTDTDVKTAYQNMCESKIEVDPGSYSFELKVIKEDKIILKSESQTVTIEQNKKIELNFVLCPPTENEAKGSVNFKLTFPNEKVNIVKAYLFKPVDDKKEPVGNMQDVQIIPEDSSSTANITVNDVPAGSYLLQVDLCYQVADYSRIETINTYTTIVQVASGFCSKAEVTLNSLTDYYTITYMVDNQKITTFQGGDNPQTTFKKNSNVTLPIACNNTNDQISIGWFYNKDCTRPVELNSDDKFSITDNITLYTQWGNNVNTNDLSFDTFDTANNIKGLLIYTETGLNYFRDIVNGTLNENIIVSDDFVYRKGTPYPTVNAKLCDDIALTEDNWEPIGYYKNDDDNKAYNGIFDGDGKCVTNLKINSNTSTDLGFFGCVQDATIKNLYVQGNINCNSIYNIGGIVGYAKSSEGNFVKISNCINNVSIKNENLNMEVGGILGRSSGAVDINSCVNIAEITNGYSVAGILGYGENNVTISNCLNLGSITMNGTYNAVAGIANIYVDPEKSSSVTSCINASSIQGKDEDDNIYPIVCFASSYSTATLLYNYYNSTILPTDTVTPVVSVAGATSLELDRLPLDGWYNNNSDSQYPIPTAIIDTFGESSCWEDTILQVAKITEATPGYVEGAYYVNGDDGDDGNDGLSRTASKRNLTNVITSLKESTENPTRTIYIDGKLTAESQGVTTQKSGNEGALVYIYEGEGCQDDDKITIKGINNALIDAENFAKFFATYGNLYLRIEDVELINGKPTASGGAFFFYESILELDNCKISNCSTTYTSLPESLTGIYMCGPSGSSILKMTNTTCKNSVYLVKTTATIGNDCVIGTSNTTATDGFITLDESTLILNGKNIDINKPIYVKNRTSSIQIDNNYFHGEQITIKLSSTITDTYNNSNQYTLITNCDEAKSNYFTIECEDSSSTATLGADGKITVN